MHLEQELERVAHGLAQRHVTLVRLMRSALYTGSAGSLRGQEARFELLMMLEDLTHRLCWVDVLSRLDVTGGGSDVTTAHAKAIDQARSLAEEEKKLLVAADALYLAAFGSEGAP